MSEPRVPKVILNRFVRTCDVCHSDLQGWETHGELHRASHSLCVFCKSLVLTRKLNEHEKQCRGFHRFRPLIYNYKSLLQKATDAILLARRKELPHVPETCFCDFVAKNSHELTSHQNETGCMHRKCRVCKILINSIMPCVEHRCVSVYFFVSPKFKYLFPFL